MPAKEIKELRQAGKLEEALNLAKAELEAEPNNIWPKRNIAWVYFEYLKQNCSPEKFDTFISWIIEIKKLELPVEDKILFEQLSWLFGKMAFGILKSNPQDHQKGFRLFETIQTFHFPKPSEGYSFLFKAFHKSLKETGHYIQFADWWNLQNLVPEDFQKEKMPNGKEVMAIAEQAYIAYAKHLLPKNITQGEVSFNKEKAEAFLPKLSEIVEAYPQFQYPLYFKAKLLLALGNIENMLESLLPFARKKRNDFWVWEVFAEAFTNDSEKVFPCYCKALLCKSPEEMLVSLRQKIASMLIAKKLFNEAKTEIEQLIIARINKSWNIPKEVLDWQKEHWYSTAVSNKSNIDFYKKYSSLADSLLYFDKPEETVIVEFVNSDRKILNFIASESKFGFFKFEKFFKDVKIGETLKVRFQEGKMEGLYQVFTAVKLKDDVFKKEFFKEINGSVKIQSGKTFGFVDDVFIHPSLVLKMQLTDGMQIEGVAIKSFNKDKKCLTWKLIS